MKDSCLSTHRGPIETEVRKLEEKKLGKMK